jgi:hypothetical protein
MPEDEWAKLALAWRAAAARFGPRDAAQRLQRAWLEGTLRVRGVPSIIPETREVVEISASEADRLTLDCPSSRIVRLSSRGRRKLMYYHSVEVRTAGDERLAQQGGGSHAVAPLAEQAPVPPDQGLPVEQARPPLEQTPSLEHAPQGNPEPDILEAKAGELVKEVALRLRRLYPPGRPRGVSREDLVRRVCKAGGEGAGGKLEPFSFSTLKRAMRLAWPQGQTRPDRA